MLRHLCRARQPDAGIVVRSRRARHLPPTPVTIGDRRVRGDGVDGAAAIRSVPGPVELASALKDSTVGSLQELMACV
jgi:hypothetical protein